MDNDEDFQAVLDIMLGLWFIWLVLSGAALIVTAVLCLINGAAITLADCFTRISNITQNVIYPITVIFIIILLAIRICRKD